MLFVDIRVTVNGGLDGDEPEDVAHDAPSRHLDDIYNCVAHAGAEDEDPIEIGEDRPGG